MVPTIREFGGGLLLKKFAGRSTGFSKRPGWENHDVFQHWESGELWISLMKPPSAFIQFSCLRPFWFSCRCESKDPSDRRSLPENPSLPVNHQVSPSESQSPSQDTVYHERSFRQQHQGKSRSRGGWDATADYYNGRNGRTRWFGPSHRHSDFNMYQNHPGGIFPRKSASEIIREFEKRAEEQEAVAAGKSVTSASTSVWF